MNKIFNRVSLTFIIIASILFINITAEATKPLPPPPESEEESIQLLNEIRVEVNELDSLFLEAQSVSLKGKGLLNRLFINKIIRGANNEFYLVKKELDKAQQAHIDKDYQGMSAFSDSIYGKTSYIKHNLQKIISGQTRSNWNVIPSDSYIY